LQGTEEVNPNQQIKGEEERRGFYSEQTGYRGKTSGEKKYLVIEKSQYN